MRPWHLRWLQPAIYGAALVAGVILALTSHSCIEARQLFGLWAFSLLIASMLIGPLTTVLPRLPFGKHLLGGRRAIGVSAFAFALVHVACYLVPVIARTWRQIFSPGSVWICGLLLGLIAFGMLAPLAWTSRDASILAMGGQRWRRLHRLVYLILPIALLHAILVGSDFGSGRAPDVKGSMDQGSLFAFIGLSCGWLILFVLRSLRRHRIQD